MSKLISWETCQRKIPESIKYERVETSDPATTLPVCNGRKLDLKQVLTKRPMLSSINQEITQFSNLLRHRHILPQTPIPTSKNPNNPQGLLRDQSSYADSDDMYSFVYA